MCATSSKLLNSTTSRVLRRLVLQHHRQLLVAQQHALRLLQVARRVDEPRNQRREARRTLGLVARAIHVLGERRRQLAGAVRRRRLRRLVLAALLRLAQQHGYLQIRCTGLNRNESTSPLRRASSLRSKSAASCSNAVLLSRRRRSAADAESVVAMNWLSGSVQRGRWRANTSCTRSTSVASRRSPGSGVQRRDLLDVAKHVVELGANVEPLVARRQEQAIHDELQVGDIVGLGLDQLGDHSGACRARFASSDSGTGTESATT
jgi:hypothetical protein